MQLIIDDGVDLTHPDLQANILPGFDVVRNTAGGGPIVALPDKYGDNHGTACAGIAAALQNNWYISDIEGISGVAPECKIIPVRATQANSSTSDWITNGINWARQNGADVISMSLGWSSPFPNVTTAITNAVTNGRGGKGCVVVAGSGNEDLATVSYPAMLANVIAVGAIDRYGQRYVEPISSEGSNYGSNLDVVAPGVNIYTTDWQGSNGYQASSN